MGIPPYKATLPTYLTGRLGQITAPFCTTGAYSAYQGSSGPNIAESLRCFFSLHVQTGQAAVTAVTVSHYATIAVNRPLLMLPIYLA